MIPLHDYTRPELCFWFSTSHIVTIGAYSAAGGPPGSVLVLTDGSRTFVREEPGNVAEAINLLHGLPA